MANIINLVPIILFFIASCLSGAPAVPMSDVSSPWLPREGRSTALYLPFIHSGLPLPPTDEAEARIHLPPGFAIRIYARNLPPAPRFMAFGPDGHLYISLMGSGKIARLPDRDFDGLSDGTEIIAEGLNLPHGLEWHDGWLYVAEVDRIERLRDANQDGAFESRELVSDNLPSGPGHNSRTIHFGPDGKMYVSAGSSCNICEESDPRRAAILRFNPDGTIPTDNPFWNDPDERKQPVWAWGLRNSVDFLWTPSGELWANHNGSDGLGDNLPPEEVVIPIHANTSHGWPYCYTPTLGVNIADEVHDERLALPAGFSCDQAVAAKFTLPAHSAPLGMSLVEGTLFPPEYRDDLYVALHGSWNTNDPASYRDCEIEWVILSGGQPVSSQTFATGWRPEGKKCGDAETWGRPADVVFSPHGEMYISDDKGMRVYRVIPLP